MWAGLIMALIALAGTAYTAASNSASVKATNAANAQAAKETNAANRAAVESSNNTNLTIAREANANDLYKFQQQMLYNTEEAQKARDFSQKMWQMTADYNNPATQAQMMRSAGINPYNSTLDGASVSAGSSPAAASAPAALPTHVPDIKPLLDNMLPNAQAPLFDMSAGNFASAAQAALNFTNSNKSNAETTEILASMQSKLDKLAAETRNLDKSSSQYAENTEALRLGNQFLKATMGDSIMSTYYDMLTKQAGWKNTIADTTLKETQAWVQQHGLIFKDKELQMHQDEINKNYEIALGNLALGMKRLQFENAWHQQDYSVSKYNAVTQRWSAKQNVRIADNQFKELKYQNLRTFRMQLETLKLDKAKVNILSRQLDGQMDLWKSQEFSNYVSPFVNIFGDILGAGSKLGAAAMFIK